MENIQKVRLVRKMEVMLLQVQEVNFHCGRFQKVSSSTVALHLSLLPNTDDFHW